ncbi:hypothetical protein [Acidianus brierleyi]|uniref:HEAT repeat domain-containing protein n=1 Tax=Acidianus brierleyi TaxID=41673 RepID=A0A2U9IHV7_9CREN|nr:hypothetical protein [Acidianus brierleyi]AWR95618.1 hypothetical protein DFR85_14495 [Acidianus brierleyi]
MDLSKEIFSSDVIDKIKDQPNLITQLVELLSSNDKDVKHKAWEILQKLIENNVIKDKNLIIDLLCYKDEGSRYRVWNFVPKMIEMKIINENDIKSSKQCLFQMLTTDNIDVRALTWYSTLPQVLPYLNKDEIYQYLKYCKDLLNSSWKDIIEETCQEF